jgi:hypothetical protein
MDRLSASEMLLMAQKNKKAHDDSKIVVGIFAKFPVCRSADGNLVPVVAGYGAPGKDSTLEINVKAGGAMRAWTRHGLLPWPIRQFPQVPQRSLSHYRIFHPADLLFRCNSLTSIEISLSLPSCRTELPVRSAAAGQ